MSKETTMHETQETAIHGWESIARFFGVSTRTMIRKRKELQEAGVIFYMYRGRPKRRVVATLPSLLRAWICLKATKGEML